MKQEVPSLRRKTFKTKVLSFPSLVPDDSGTVVHPGMTANMPPRRVQVMPGWLRRLLKWLGLAVAWPILAILALYCLVGIFACIMWCSDAGGWTRSLPAGWERVIEVETVDELAAAMLPCKDLRHQMRIVYEDGDMRVLHTWTAREWAGTWTLTCMEVAGTGGKILGPMIVYEDVLQSYHVLSMSSLAEGKVSLIWWVADGP